MYGENNSVYYPKQRSITTKHSLLEISSKSHSPVPQVFRHNSDKIHNPGPEDKEEICWVFVTSRLSYQELNNNYCLMPNKNGRKTETNKILQLVPLSVLAGVLEWVTLKYLAAQVMHVVAEADISANGRSVYICISLINQWYVCLQCYLGDWIQM